MAASTAPKHMASVAPRLTNDEGAMKRRLIDSLAIAAMCVGVMLSMAGAMGGTLPLVVACVTAAVVCFAMRFAASKPALRRAILIGFIVVALAVLAVGLSFFVRGALGWVNYYISALNNLADSYNETFSVTPSMTDACVFAFVVGIGFGVVFSLALYHHSLLEVGLLGLIFMFGGILFQATTPLFMAVFIVGWMVSLARVRRVALQTGAPYHGMLVLVVGAVAIAFALTSGFTGSDVLARGKAGLFSAIDQMRYGSDDLPQGNLYDACYMLSGSTTDRLDIKFDSSSNVTPLYLAGYTGAIYQPNTSSWSSLGRDIYSSSDWNGLFTWLASASADPLSQYSAYSVADESTGGVERTHTTVDVEATGAYRKYAYLPYNIDGQATTPFSTTTSSLDRFRNVAALRGATSYSFSSTDNPTAVELSAPSPWVYDAKGASAKAQSFSDAESAYHAFVYDYYLSVPDSLTPVINSFFYAQGWNTAESHDLYTTAMRIRTLLSASCVYSAAPSSDIGDTDYVTWFLTDGRTGNSAAYASAAVLAFREAGIPARYAEGYLLSESIANSMRSSGATRAKLNNEDGHAWVEVYIDGMGWMPIEVTPGFYSDVVSSDQVVEVSEQVTGGNTNSNDSGTYDPAQQAVEVAPADDTLGFSWIGVIIAGLLLVAAIAFAVGEITRLLWIKRWHETQSADDTTFARAAYDRLRLLATDGGVDTNWERPLDACVPMADRYPNTVFQEHEHMLELIQGTIFGGKEMTAGSRHAIQSYLYKIERANSQDAGLVERLRQRYLHDYSVEFNPVMDEYL